MTRKLTSSIVLLPFCLGQWALAGNVAFRPAQSYTVGTNPSAVAVADFNSDGKMDLAVMNVGDPAANDSGSVSILLGNGDGTFQSANNITAGKNPRAMAIGDFNGDHKVDVAVINDDLGGAVGVLLGNGDGTLQSVVDYPAIGPSSLAVADLNKDGRFDLIVGESADVGILIGNGDGTFQAMAHYASSNGSNKILLADLNDDGVLDVVGFGTPGGGLGVLLGNRDGTLQSRTDYLSGTFVSDVTPFDFNGDGKQDLVIANGQVSTLAGTGNGAFHQVWDSGQQSMFVAEVRFGDFNGDSKRDLIVEGPSFGNFTASGTSLLLNNGDGTFSAGSIPPTSACRNSSPIAADFDGDGKLDLALLANDNCLPSPKSNPRILVFAGNGDGTFQAPVSYTVLQSGSLGGAGNFIGAVADLDNNGSPDLVAIQNAPGNIISVLMNSASTDFSISATALTPSTITPGQSSTSTISLSLLNAFDNPVSLDCSVQPAQAGAPTCSLTSNSVVFNKSGKATATLTISSGSSLASLGGLGAAHRLRGLVLWFSVVGFAFVGTGLGANLPKRRVALIVLMGVLLFAGLIAQTACGGGTTGDPKSTAYSVTINGTSGAIRHIARVSITVQ